MALTLRYAGENDVHEWDAVVQASANGTIFHTWSWLKIAEKHTKTTLYPVMAYKGTELVAIFPFFVRKHALYKLAFSPPPGAYLLYLGPLFTGYDKMKQDKREGVYFELLKEVDTLIFKKLGCSFSRINTSPRLYDSRAFYWLNYSVSPYYTYRIPLSEGVDHVQAQFDRKLRGDIKKTIREGVTVKNGERKDLSNIYQSISQRFVDQGFKPKNHLPYILDIYDAFSPEHIKIFLAEYNEQIIGGMIALKYKDIAYLWVGVPKSKIPGISPNDLVQWEGIQWACNSGCQYYEEMDSGEDSRLTAYKSKYNPNIEIWFSATKYSSGLYKIADLLRSGF
ncbi:MAG: FemAB family protein [Methanoregula sp. PtaU1.Bin006]|uniref:lipid II:glycine glycyltransferase FemX n=1 Tax=Methanoregula sp. PtaU1.Bin006 TaxID=1811681 RepID=UPI0009CDB1F0|nr:GNAT family N-acetyltransferase [Methanoregula sp. PtaU1.Bin006]OPY37228.1 MAG: FemAB family protein [Methanoregula sp. PtaU1.Bin006]